MNEIEDIITNKNLSDYIKRRFNNNEGRKASEVIKTILERSGHIPSATAIARGAGFCTYHARLIEGIGVKPIYNHTVDRASGKGDDTHKILGLASLRLFTDGINHIDDNTISSIVKEASNELREHSLIQREQELNSSESQAVEILKIFFKNRERFERILNINIKNTIPIIEQQLIDYELRIRGIPDLILEDKNERKAIVIDWKTSKEYPSYYESAQVICYALLEAKRLSYDIDESIRSILGELNSYGITSINILPVIIRPKESLTLTPHPIFVNEPNKIRDKYVKFAELIRNVIIMAQHLTVLLSNQETITGIKHEDTKGPVDSGIRANYVRLTPPDLNLNRGNPSTQDRYPCNACYLTEPCKFYFGQYPATSDEYAKTMWHLRFIVFDEKEESLLPYLALYKIFKFWSYNEVINYIKKGKSFQYDFSSNPFYNDREKGKIIIKRDNKYDKYKKDKEIKKRVDVIDNIEPIESLSFRASRKIRDYEKDFVYVINKDKTVLITIPYPRTNVNPLLSINFFGRIYDISINNSDIIYFIDLPSKVLKYQALLFTKYCKYDLKDIFMSEVDVDLTKLDLYAIDYIHRRLGNSDENENERETEVKIMEESKYTGLDEDEEKEFEEFLKEVIRESRR